MPKTYSYQKVIDDYTTHELIQPDYEQMAEGAARITELCTIDGWTHVAVPDGLALPKQPAQVQKTLRGIVLTSELKAEIKQASPHVKLLNRRMAADENIRYSKQDEATLGFMSELAASPVALDAYMAKCREWETVGKAESIEL